MPRLSPAQPSSPPHTSTCQNCLQSPPWADPPLSGQSGHVYTEQLAGPGVHCQQCQQWQVSICCCWQMIVSDCYTDTDHCGHHLAPVKGGESWNNGKEVPRWGVAEIQKMSPSTTGRCKYTREWGQPTNRSEARRHGSQSHGFAVQVWLN